MNSCFFCNSTNERLGDVELHAHWGQVGEYLKAGTYPACDACQKRVARIVRALLSSLKGAL